MTLVFLVSCDLWDEVGQDSRDEEDEMFKDQDEDQPSDQNLQHSHLMYTYLDTRNHMPRYL